MIMSVGKYWALLCIICCVCSASGNEQKAKHQLNAKHLSSAALWIPPGTTEVGVLAFFGEPSFKDDKNCFWYEFEINLPADEEGEVRQKAYARIFFDDKKQVANVEVFTVQLKQTSASYHQRARGIR